MGTPSTDLTVADVIARCCAAHGVRQAFGVPGGGSSLDLIAAFDRHGIAFTLMRTEAGAVLAAAADAELRHGFGVALTTQGPGAASAMNGLAHAALDRAPVLFVSDGWTAAQAAFDTHQVFDQRAMSAPVVKAWSRLASDAPGAELGELVGLMCRAPWGPAHIELTGENARRAVPAAAVEDRRLPVKSDSAEGERPADDLAAAAALLARARRPVLIAGLELREAGAADALAALAERWRCPVLGSYKAKGHVSDDSPWCAGHFTGGAAERPLVDAADLIVLVGFDPVELIGRPWGYAAPVVDIARVPHPVHYLTPEVRVTGPLAPRLEALLPTRGASRWTLAEVAAHRQRMQASLDVVASPAAGSAGSRGLTPQQVVRGALQIGLALEAAGTPRPAITVDAGAHMFSAMAFWRAREPGSALISNGLATMAFALPAAIALALSRPERPTIAFTGDGGLMMCAGELAAAAQCRARLCVVVFNDSALSLIALKQRQRGLSAAGVGFAPVDFAAVARGFGLIAWTAGTVDAYEHALRQALACDGPCLIDATVDPSGYPAQARALRG